MSKEYKKEEYLIDEERDSKATIRLKAMINAFHAGKLTSVNGRKDGTVPERNFDDLPDDVTVYAHLSDEELEKYKQEDK